MYLCMKKILLIVLLTFVLVGCAPSDKLGFSGPTAIISKFPIATNTPEFSKISPIEKTPEPIQFSTPTTAVWVKPIDKSTKIRSGPGINFEVIGILSDDELAAVIGKTSDAEWLQVSVETAPGWTSGWLYSQAVVIEGDQGVLPCVSTDTVPCETNIPPDSFETETAIKNIRLIMQNPNLDLVFTGISQSPNLYLRDAMLFVDNQGTEYYVDLATNQVVEFTQAQVLPASDLDKLELINLREIAERIAAESSAQFSAMEQSLVYSEGIKDDRYFFRWEKQNYTGKSLPLLQIGLDQSGTIISYLNTLDVLK